MLSVNVFDYVVSLCFRDQAVDLVTDIVVHRLHSHPSSFFHTIHMPLNFALLHIPPLLVAAALTFGGLIPFFNAEYAILEFGLPSRVAISKPAQSIMIVSSARITAIGLALLTFYFGGQL